MRLDWLDDLVALLDNRSMDAAARSRFLTQPAYSRRVKALEEVLGFELVERARKPARPVNLLVEHEAAIRDLASRTRELIVELRRESRNRHDRIAIASQHSITTSFIPRMIEALSQRGQTQIRLRSANLDECHALLVTRQVELALTYRIPGEVAMDESFVEHEHIADDRLIPVFSRRSADALVEGFRAGSLPIIAYPANVFLGRVLAQAVLPQLERSAIIRPIAETALTLAALQSSKQGIALSWVPARLAEDDIAAGLLVDLSEVFPSQPLNLIVSRLTGRRSTLEDDVWQLLVDSVL